MTNDELLADGCMDVSESAKFVGVGQTFLYAEMTAGRLRYIKLGRRRLIPKNELIRFAAAGLTGGFALASVEQAEQLATK